MIQIKSEWMAGLYATTTAITAYISILTIEPYAGSNVRFWILLESFRIFSEMATKGADDSITR